MKRDHDPPTASRPILVLGATGTPGHALLRFFAPSTGFSVTGSVRSAASLALLPAALRHRIVSNVDVESLDNLTRLIADTKPDVVINAIGLVKQLAQADDPLSALPINSLLPHRLAQLC